MLIIIVSHEFARRTGRTVSVDVLHERKHCGYARCPGMYAHHPNLCYTPGKYAHTMNSCLPAKLLDPSLVFPVQYLSYLPWIYGPKPVQHRPGRPSYGPEGLVTNLRYHVARTAAVCYWTTGKGEGLGPAAPVPAEVHKTRCSIRI